MINFPDTPTLAQIFTTAGSSWQWDGSKWEGATVAGGGPYLLLTGGTLTGQLTVNPNIVIGNPVTSPPATSLVINRAASTPQASTTPLIWAASEAGGNGVLIDIYSPTATANLTARKARGTAAAPTAVQAADTLSNIITTGYGASAYGTATTLAVKASENWSNTAQGSFFAFSTNTPGTTTIVQRATINQGVVIGNAAPDPGQGGLVLNANAAAPQPPPAGMLLQIAGVDGTATNTLIDAYGGASALTFRRADGTAAAPTAVQISDYIGVLNFMGRGAASYGGGRTVVGVRAAENWTDTAQGTQLLFSTTLNGTTSNTTAMTVDHNGNVGIGTTTPGTKLMVQSATQFDGITVRNATNITASLAGLSATNDGGVLQLLNAGTPQVYLSATSNSYLNGGNVGIGTTTPAAGVKLTVRNSGAAGSVASLIENGPSGADATSVMMMFQDYGSTIIIGGINRTGTNSVAYATTSDERLKDAISESKRGLDALMAIKVSDYKMGKTAQQGLLAQDVAKVYPEAVHEGGKDPNLQPWMLDYGRLTPLIIKAVQDLAAEVKALTPPPARRKAA